MQKVCESCGRPFEAKRAAARFCGDTCKKRAQRLGPVPLMPSRESAPASSDSPLVLVTRTTLEGAGVLDTVSGQAALLLAERLSVGSETGAAMATLSKQLEAVVTAALASVRRADQMDEVTRRRDAKLAAARGA